MAEVTINGRDGSFKAYVGVPKTRPAPGIVVGMGSVIDSVAKLNGSGAAIGCGTTTRT